ncbi:hypothetical protein [Nocardia gipuzkoensis]
MAVLPGTPARLLVSEQWTTAVAGLLKSDNAFVYAAGDGTRIATPVMFRSRIDSPRIELTHWSGDIFAVLNTSHGVLCRNFGADGRDGRSHWIFREGLADDFSVGVLDARPVVAVAHYSYAFDHLWISVFDLLTGQPVGDPWDLGATHEWTSNVGSDPVRMGRWYGRPIVGALNWGLWLYAWDGASAWFVVPRDDCACCEHALVALDDAAGPSLAVIREHDSVVRCYTGTADLGNNEMLAPYGAPIMGAPGRVIGGRLGRWRSRPALALRTEAGVSLWNLADNEWVCHVPITDSVHDVAFAPDGSLAAIAESGPLVIDVE